MLGSTTSIISPAQGSIISQLTHSLLFEQNRFRNPNGSNALREDLEGLIVRFITVQTNYFEKFKELNSQYNHQQIRLFTSSQYCHIQVYHGSKPSSYPFSTESSEVNLIMPKTPPQSSKLHKTSTENTLSAVIPEDDRFQIEIPENFNWKYFTPKLRTPVRQIGTWCFEVHTSDIQKYD
ncbi:unnamed protein product [Ambrosiozyma monospora]|uniref:Unnamed protein product n=1 Tax=Ambrosiozyma monospora TaxID=43982 RepID=A0ACB5T236_AMBMO|nr:unnamed protein product [Ambrosiozyma monospora]